MKILLTIFLSFISVQSFAEDRCRPKSPGEDILRNSDFSWNQTLEQILKRGQELYISPKRLDHRAYKNDKGEYVIPLDIMGVIKEAKISDRFIRSVTLHIEEALKRRYVDAIHFSDMGHSHFFIPQDFYDRELKDIPFEEKHILYEKMLNHEGLKVLYHTAEQLVMKNENGELLPDRHIQWRFFTRNLIGDNEALGKLELLHNETHAWNTAHEYDPGYRYWGAGFYISANEKGCFPFRHEGKIYYFDINLEGIN